MTAYVALALGHQLQIIEQVIIETEAAHYKHVVELLVPRAEDEQVTKLAQMDALIRGRDAMVAHRAVLAAPPDPGGDPPSEPAPDGHEEVSDP